MVPVRADDFTSQGFVAPTVFLLANKNLPRWNYYNSLKDAADKYNYLLPGADPGRNVAPAGSVSFVNNGQPQTLGINVDFYFFD